MFVYRLMGKAVPPFGLALFWIGLALVLGQNWWFVPLPLAGAALRTYGLGYAEGQLVRELWLMLVLNMVYAAAIIIIASMITDEDLVQTIAYGLFVVMGLWFAFKACFFAVMAYVQRNDVTT